MELNLDKTFIINGDDFGMTPGINQAIRQLHQHGRLTSTSIMVNMPWSPEALVYARSSPDLGAGVHLNLTTGRPISPAHRVRSLVNSKGQFYSLSAFLSLFIAGLIRRSEIKAELAAQIEVCLDHNINLQHIDSHMHFHAVPALGQLVSKLAANYDIGAVRNPNPDAFVVPLTSRKRPVENALRKTGKSVLKSTQKIVSRRALAPGGPANRADQLIYLRWCLGPDNMPPSSLRTCLAGLNGRTIEIIAHPSVPDEVLPTLSSYVEGRQRELAILDGDPLFSLLEALLE